MLHIPVVLEGVLPVGETGAAVPEYSISESTVFGHQRRACGRLECAAALALAEYTTSVQANRCTGCNKELEDRLDTLSTDSELHRRRTDRSGWGNSLAALSQWRIVRCSNNRCLNKVVGMQLGRCIVG